MARSGAFVVVWTVEETSGDPGGPAPGIFVRRYDSGGNALGTDFQVDSFTLGAQYADRMVLLDGGRIAADGAPEDVLTRTLIAEHYAATIEVLELDGRIAVVPARPPR